MTSALESSERLSQRANQLLAAFLSAAEGREEAEALQTLMAESIEPIITSVVENRFKLSLRRAKSGVQTETEQDAEDIRGRAILEMTGVLRGSKCDPLKRPPADIRAYTAVTTYRTFGKYLAEKHRPRHDLRERIRYLVSHRSGLTIWKDGKHRLMCGRTGWSRRPETSGNRSRILALRDNPEPVLHEYARQVDPRQTSLSDLVKLLIDAAGEPIALEDLVEVVAALLQEELETSQSAYSSEVGETVEQVASREASPSQLVEQREYICRMWQELRRLPKQECAALLLDMARAEGLAVIMQFPLHGAATIEEIGQAVGMDLARFGELWRDLPLHDDSIAEILGLSPQKVINLRRSGRERLAKRMKEN